jgi:hypothetical protein
MHCGYRTGLPSIPTAPVMPDNRDTMDTPGDRLPELAPGFTPRIPAADGAPMVLRAGLRIPERGRVGEVRATTDGRRAAAHFAAGGADMVMLELPPPGVEATGSTASRAGGNPLSDSVPVPERAAA